MVVVGTKIDLRDDEEVLKKLAERKEAPLLPEQVYKYNIISY